MLSSRGQAGLKAKILFSASKIVLDLGLEHLSSACPRSFFGLEKITEMMELVLIVSLQ